MSSTRGSVWPDVNPKRLGQPLPCVLASCSPHGLSWAGFAHCLWLSLADNPCSWHLQLSGASPTLWLHFHIFRHCLLKGQLLCLSGLPVSPQHLHSACLKNQKHVDHAKFCHQLQQWPGPFRLRVQTNLLQIITYMASSPTASRVLVLNQNLQRMAFTICIPINTDVLSSDKNHPLGCSYSIFTCRAKPFQTPPEN